MFIDKKELARKLDKPIDQVVVGFTASSFDLMHAGHIVIFERYVQVASCQYVDEVIPFESEKDLEDMIRTISPDIRIVGEEYKGKEHTGKGLCHIHYNKRRHSFSTSELRERVSKCT